MLKRVSSMNCGPRGANGASAFMNAHPECDIDSTAAANPMLIAPTAQQVVKARVRERAPVPSAMRDGNYTWTL
jgi:hypothetical protein